MADDALQQQVLASTREAEVAALGPAAEPFIALQHAAQQRGFAAYAGVTTSVVEADGVPVGRLVVARGPEAVHVVDVALLPAHRARGIGTQLLRDLLAEAGAAGLPVTLHVEAGNPAARLYDRLGFVPEPAPADALHRAWRAQPKIAS